MTTNIQSSSRRRAQRSFGAITLTVSLALLVLALQSPAAAQSAPAATPSPIVTTTIIPMNVNGAADPTFKTDGVVTLNFQTPTLPANAEVVKATLQLSLFNKLRSSDGTVKVTFNGADGSEGNFGSRNFNVNTPPGKDSPMQWTTTTGEVPPGLRDLGKKTDGSTFALKLVPFQNPAREWYSINAESKFRPRLILEYTVPNRPVLWQTEGVLNTHSPKPFLPSPAGAQFNSRDVSAIYSYAPVFYNGLVYLISPNGNQYQLQALPALGVPPVQTTTLANPGQHLLVSESGRLYVVGNGQILLYQLDPANGAFQAPTSKSVTDLNPVVAPALGADGSLYFVNRQEVYGLNPSLQELWKVTLDATTTSRLTVGPGGQFVYLLGKIGGVMGLIAIDTRTGEVFTAKLPNSDQLVTADNPTLLAPVVMLNSDRTEKIYVAANSVKAGVLTEFDNQKTGPRGPEKGKITTAWTTPLNGLFSQPTASNGEPRKIYSVQVTESQGQLQGQLKAIDWQSGSAQPVGDPFHVNASSNLPTGGNLAIDNKGNVLVWDGAEPKLYAFGSDAAGFASSVFTGVKNNSRLLFGGDGTLYAADPGNAANRILRAILPQYTLTKDSGPNISSPTHLRVDGIAGKDTTLSAGGNITVGPEFKVTQGMTLRVKTNVPQ